MVKKKEKPITRDDVLRLIKENGGTAEGLDLSGKVFKEGINLRGLDLKGIILNGAILINAHLERAKLRHAHLEGADLTRVHLEESSLSRAHLEEAELWNAHLERSQLWGVHFEGALLRGAHLEGAVLRLVKLSPHTELADVDWGSYVLGEENIGAFKLAADTYRQLKAWHVSVGIYDTAGEFFFREMTARRNDYWWGSIDLPVGDLSHPVKLKKFPKALFPRKPFHWAWSKLVSIICGYGERPLRVVGWAFSVITFMALVYFLIGSVWQWGAFWRSLYFSAVSFTALGYGSWINETWINMTSDWIRGLGAAESFLGVFMMALFLVTFIRKMTR